jgi:hypothetical protein
LPREFDPTAAAPAATLPLGHNKPPVDVLAEIDDLFEEAKNFADGEPIASQDMHDTVTKLYDAIHDAGKHADEIRKAEKKPHDDAAQAVQDKFNPFIQPKKGKVDQAKAALGELLAVWRAAEQKKKAEEAARVAEEAAAARREAEEATRAKVDLAARIEAEEKLAHAKSLEKTAKRADKAATEGTGLRTVWIAEMTDAEAALDWAYGRDARRFTELVQAMADEAVRTGTRNIPGFTVRDDKVASARRVAA